ncbi:MAG: spore maturation protein A [Clostridia bacterium]|nr:spore maturation protein A [Clostridia bacterium]
MLGKIFGILCLLSLLAGILNGNAPQLGSAVLDGAGQAVEVLLSLGGMLCFWGGMMNVWKEAGAIQGLSRLLSPLLRRIFPVAAAKGEGLEEISANLSANLLGMGNAATPMGLAAMEKLQRQNPHPEKASAEQITLVVMNTAAFSLLPTNLLALRRAAGSASPYAVMGPIWIASLVCTLLAILLCRLFGAASQNPSGAGKKP